MNGKTTDYTVYADFLVKIGAKHTILLCPNSATVKVDGKSYFFPNGERVPPVHLNFITKTKKEVIEAAERKKIGKQNPKYFGFGKIYGERKLYNFLEIDINGAYWETAYKEGLLSESTYQKGLTVPKRVRLMAFGAAASMKDVYEYDGKSYSIKDPIYNEYGRRAFFHVAALVGKLMSDISSMIPSVFLLYWVDAIFVHSLWSVYVFQRLESAGYEYTTKEIPVIFIKQGSGQKPDQIVCVVKESENENNCAYERKTFLNPKRNIKKLPNVAR